MFYLLVSSIALFYAWLIGSFRKAWDALPVWKTDSPPQTAVSIVVPVRNEGTNLEPCLSSLLQQNYPPALREIIVVDDFSEDGTADVAASFADRGVRLIRLQDLFPGEAGRSSKKLALQSGIDAATGKLIATFDGDSCAPPGWLAAMAGYYEKHRPVLMAGPVAFTGGPAFLVRFQALDLFAMTGTSAAGIARRWFHLGNGTNLFYEREAFHAIGGFEGIDRLASGDDVFIMQKMAEVFPGRLAFVKSAEALVRTAPAKNWTAFWQQRLRWGSKASQYKEWKLTALAALVLVFSWSIILSPVFAPLAFVPVFALKSWADYRLLKQVARFFHSEALLSVFWKSQFLHVSYIAISGLASVFFRRYRWKGRRTQ